MMAVSVDINEVTYCTWPCVASCEIMMSIRTPNSVKCNVVTRQQRRTMYSNQYMDR